MDDKNLEVKDVILTDELLERLKKFHKEVRVYSKDFAFLTQDFVMERFNVGIDKDNKIVDTWFG